MKNNITTIIVNDFLGNHNYKIELEKNTLIFVAPNGSGKTTLLRIIYHYLSGQWEKLNKNELSQITSIINKKNTHFDLNKQTNTLKNKKDSLIKEYSEYKDALNDLFKTPIKELKSNPFLVKEIAAEYDAHEPLLQKIINDLAYQELNKDTLPLNNLQILFLPTYRRIERNVEEVFPDFAKKLTKLLKENIKSISNKITQEINTLQTIRKNYKEYEDNIIIPKFITEELLESNTPYSQTEQDIKNEIDNFWEDINKSNKTKNNTNNVLFEELIGFGMKDIELLIKDHFSKKTSDNILSLFIEKCNNFLEQKKIKINKKNGVFIQQQRDKKKLSLDQLSSGEKQLISLFAHIIFSPLPTFLIIDEPELSLSIKWQSELLKELNSLSMLQGMIIATHSTHIFKDHFLKKTHSLEEFIIKNEE